jgi:hypothetical protein
MGTTGNADPNLSLKGPGEAPAVFLQRVPERKTVKNRLHWDLCRDRPEALCPQIEELGATLVGGPFG